MIAGSAPAKFPIPFASSAGSSFKRPIPQLSQISIQPGAASLQDGFPPITFVDINAGGKGPAGEDFNGLLNQITSWDQWTQAGGPIKYDAAFSTAIGGYPFGAQVQSNTGHAIYESLVDNNVADPNSGNVQWRILSCVWSSTTIQATGSANIQTVTLSPAPTSLGQMLGIRIRIGSQGNNTGATTLNVNGLGAIPIQFPGGVPLGAGVLSTNSAFEVVYNGSAFTLLSYTNVYTDPGSAGTAGITVDGTGSTRGANLLLKGNGGTTPNKWVRAFNGILQFLNSAYTTTVFQVDDSGNASVPGSLAAGGNIVSSARLRAGIGALGSGDTSAATILADFNLFSGGLGTYQKLPSGFIVQGGNIAAGASMPTPTTVVFPIQFPTVVSTIIVSEGHGAGWLTGGRNVPTLYSSSDQTLQGFNVYTFTWNTTTNTWSFPPGSTSCNWFAIGY